MAGPITIELTASMIRCYKSCPRRYELEYIEMLKPEEKIEALEIGSNYHTRIEALLKGKEWNRDGVIGKMVEAFDRFVPWRSWRRSGRRLWTWPARFGDGSISGATPLPARS